MLFRHLDRCSPNNLRQSTPASRQAPISSSNRPQCHPQAVSPLSRLTCNFLIKSTHHHLPSPLLPPSLARLCRPELYSSSQHSPHLVPLPRLKYPLMSLRGTFTRCRRRPSAALFKMIPQPTFLLLGRSLANRSMISFNEMELLFLSSSLSA